MAGTGTDGAIGVGIVGLGVQGRAVRAELEAAAGFGVVATYDPAAPAVDATARDGVAAVCAAPGVDLVYVASPPAAHAEAVEHAVAAGRALLCEKPLAPDAATAARLAALVRAAGVPAGVNFYLASAEPGLRLLAGVDAGLLGEVVALEVRARFARWPRPWQSAAGAWLAGAAEGGFTREVLSHFVWLADRIAGPGVVESARVERGDDGLETRVAAVVRHGAVRCRIDAAVEGEADDVNRFTVAGSRGSAAIVDWDGLDGVALPPVADAGLPAAVRRLVAGEAGALPDLDAAARVVAIVEALLASRCEA